MKTSKKRKNTELSENENKAQQNLCNIFSFPVPTFKPHKEHKNDLIIHLKILKKCKQRKFKPGNSKK